MQLSLLALFAGALLPLGLSTAAAAAATEVPQTSVTFRIPATQHLQNLHTLPASTHATLSTFHKTLSAPLSTSNTFVFRNVTAGSYLVDFHCATHMFAPLRLDVSPPVDDHGGKAPKLVLKAWETFRGNDWDNKGEAVPLRDDVFDARLLGAKSYFMERSKFNVLSILKNPMILLGLVSMAIFIGMPYLVDNMDPEMRAEWDERQKTNPMNGIMGAASGQGGANPVGNFDVAAFLAGSSKKSDNASATSSATLEAASTPSGGKGKGKKR
ncbi:hypothetical protein B0H63DRAFT_558555 [Podospora didyma]|uniref:ER membrane protein complex subunit 7 beta-sandwich domain-containing protein n=1 Tax=Podospora didyma TaxID=330526 RepID=A0AAE0NSY7_9PEZI|nr:hypothetical protein B0H63DRAFT_558555 [Podospora didyma]